MATYRFETIYLGGFPSNDEAQDGSGEAGNGRQPTQTLSPAETMVDGA